MCDYGSDSTTDLMGCPEDVLATGKEMGLLDGVTLQIDRSDNPLTLHSPIRGNHGFHKQFGTICEWREFIRSHNLHAAIPQTIAEKFQRAQKLYFLAWIDFDVIKAGELMALVALELALKSRYRDKTLGMLLEHIVEQDGLTNEKIPMFKKNGFVIVENLYETKQAREARKKTPGCPPPKTISEIRNSLAHGDTFDVLPWAGLLELVRDLIEYAYRDWIAEGAP